MKKEKVLIVEDEKDTRYILERLLSKNNFEVLSSINGEDALEKLKEFEASVILADWTMPIMDGIELCKIIKSDEKKKLIYFIMLTARASLKDRITGLDVGADDFLVKPIDNQELLARIRSGVRIYSLQNELKTIEHDRAIIEMACTIGHKINNPLSSLSVTLTDLRSQLLKKTEFKEDFEIIFESIERIKKLVNNLIEIESPEIIDYTQDNKMLKID